MQAFHSLGIILASSNIILISLFVMSKMHVTTLNFWDISIRVLELKQLTSGFLI